MFAGTDRSSECVLILTEGDSAKALAVAGLDGLPKEARKRYGVFPLRGKMLNTRDAAQNRINDNAELSALKKIMGLKSGKQYSAEEASKELRYGGGIMVMADQDVDGQHITGLVLNAVQHQWPSLTRVPGFMQRFRTPLVKVSKRGGVTISFFDAASYQKWRVDVGEDEERRWTAKYYKGLGTSSAAEGRAYFADMQTPV